MNAPARIAAPTARQVQRDAALRDLRTEFEQRWQSLLAEYEARKARIEREFWTGHD